MLKLQRAAVVTLFQELGQGKAADGWSKSRMLQRLDKLPGTVDDDTADVLKTEESKTLLKKIVKAHAALDDGQGFDESTVELLGFEKGESPAEEAAEEKPAAKKAAAKKPAADDGDEEDAPKPKPKPKAEAADEDDEDAPAPKKAAAPKADAEEGEKKKGPPKGTKPPSKAGGEGGPGIIGSIVEFLKGASAEKPITKKGIVTKLSKRFEDRDASAMAKTVNVQVPNRIKTDKKLDVRSVDLEGGGKGYYIAPAKGE